MGKAGLKFSIGKTKIMASSSITSWQIDGEKSGNTEILFSWASKSLRMMIAAMMLAHWKESYDKPRQCIKKQRHHFADKGPYRQSYGFSSRHVRM